MSHNHGCDIFMLNRSHDQSQCSLCKKFLSVYCNGCGGLHERCSGLKRSGDRPSGFHCSQSISKAVHWDRNVPTAALLTDLYTENKDHTTSLPPQEAQVVGDDANDRPIVPTPQKLS